MRIAQTIQYGQDFLSLSAIAKRNGMNKKTLWFRWVRAGRPTVIEPGSELVSTHDHRYTGEPVQLTVDGQPTNPTRAAGKLGVSVRRVRDRMEMYGPHLTSAQIIERQGKAGQVPYKRPPSDGPMVTPEERQRLAKIPSPTPYEYRLRGVQI